MLNPDATAALTFDFDDEDEQAEFKFSELSDRAKAHARDQHRDWNVDHDWWDSTFDDAVDIANMMGISIDTRSVRLYGGGTRQEPSIWFSGFWSQGDGASFEGRWSPVDEPIAILNAVMAHAPQDERLHAIAFTFADLSERHGPQGKGNYETIVSIKRGSSSYCHEHSVTIDFDSWTPPEYEDWNDLQQMTWDALQIARGFVLDDWKEEVAEAMRDLMRWVYDQLRAEYEYLTSDEAIDEILADMTFDEDGETI